MPLRFAAGDTAACSLLGLSSAARDLAACRSAPMSGKRYGGVVALDDITLAVHGQSIHAVLGENGAGKSTLIKIIGGVVPPDSGRIRIDGKEMRLPGATDAIANGIVCVFQELSLIPDLTVADNICITDPPPAAGPDRPPRATAPLRGAAGDDRLRGHQPAPAHQGPAAVATPAHRDRQGARAQPASARPRRGDLGVDGSGRPAGLSHRPQSPRTRAGRHLHLPSHARDRGARRYLHGAARRPSHRNLQEAVKGARGDPADDDRPRSQPHLSTEARAGRREANRARCFGLLLDQQALRRDAHDRPRRNRRPRRTRRAGPTRAAARPFRRAARDARRDQDRRAGRSPCGARQMRRPPACRSRWCPRTARAKGSCCRCRCART